MYQKLPILRQSREPQFLGETNQDAPSTPNLDPGKQNLIHATKDLGFEPRQRKTRGHLAGPPAPQPARHNPTPTPT